MSSVAEPFAAAADTGAAAEEAREVAAAESGPGPAGAAPGPVICGSRRVWWRCGAGHCSGTVM